MKDFEYIKYHVGSNIGISSKPSKELLDKIAELDSIKKSNDAVAYLNFIFSIPEHPLDIRNSQEFMCWQNALDGEDFVLFENGGVGFALKPTLYTLSMFEHIRGFFQQFIERQESEGNLYCYKMDGKDRLVRHIPITFENIYPNVVKLNHE